MSFFAPDLAIEDELFFFPTRYGCLVFEGDFDIEDELFFFPTVDSCFVFEGDFDLEDELFFFPTGDGCLVFEGDFDFVRRTNFCDPAKYSSSVLCIRYLRGFFSELLDL